MLRGVTVPPMVTFPNTYGGKLDALQKYQLPDRGKLNIQPVSYTHLTLPTIYSV